MRLCKRAGIPGPCWIGNYTVARKAPGVHDGAWVLRAGRDRLLWRVPPELLELGEGVQRDLGGLERLAVLLRGLARAPVHHRLGLLLDLGQHLWWRVNARTSAAGSEGVQKQVWSTLQR